MLEPTKTDKTEAAQRLADAVERVRLAQDRVREAQYVLAQAQQQRDAAMREFQDAYKD